MTRLDEIRELIAFNRWANRKILEAAAALSDGRDHETDQRSRRGEATVRERRSGAGLDLVDTRSTPGGVLINTYRPAGRLGNGSN